MNLQTYTLIEPAGPKTPRIDFKDLELAKADVELRLKAI